MIVQHVLYVHAVLLNIQCLFLLVDLSVGLE